MGEGQAFEENVLHDLGKCMQGLICTMCVGMRTLCITEQMMKLYSEAFHAVGACATINLA